MYLHMKRSKLLRIALQRAGGMPAVAKALFITPQAVQCWTKVPAKHVLILEAMSGVSRHLLRPDIFGPPPPQLQFQQFPTTEAIPLSQVSLARDFKIEM